MLGSSKGYCSWKCIKIRKYMRGSSRFWRILMFMSDYNKISLEEGGAGI